MGSKALPNVTLGFISRQRKMVAEDLSTRIERTLVYIIENICIFSPVYFKGIQIIILSCIPTL